jgi:Domain of unknown function (DUF4389)
MNNDFSVSGGVLGAPVHHAATHPVDVEAAPALTHRKRLTVAFRPLLAIPHILFVGGPVAFATSLWWRADHESRFDVGAGAGVLGAVACVITIIAWFAIVFAGQYPEGLWSLAAYYLRWRVRAVAYLTLLRDEYPPFGDDSYPARLMLNAPARSRDRLTVALRPVLAIPHFIVLWFLGIAWGVTTVIAWVSIVITGNYPSALYQFAVGVLRWSTLVEAYVLLLRDEYPPFSLE